MTICINLSDAKDTAIRIGVAAVVTAGMAAGSSCTAKAEIPPGFEDDPLTVVRVFNDDVNARMTDAAVDLIDDDAVFIDQTGHTFSGKTNVGGWLQERVKRNERYEFCDLWVSGDRVIWTERVFTADSLRVEKNEAIVQRGRITLFRLLQGAK